MSIKLQKSSADDASLFRLNGFSLRFSGETAHMEEAFLEDYAERNLPRLRLSVLAGILLYSLFAILDTLVVPEMKHLTWLIRFAIVMPVALTGVALSYQPYWQKRFQVVLSTIFIVAGGGIVLMIAIIPSPVNLYYYVGLILVYIFGYTLINIRFVWASLSGLLIMALYTIAAAQLSLSRLEILTFFFFLAGANFAGMLACYNIEYTNRRNFFLLRSLRDEQQKIIDLKNRLEQKVIERTEKLEEVHQQLKRAEKMEAIGRLAAGVAHDLNNHLTGLVGYPELLMMELDTDSKLRKAIGVIHQSGLKAAAIVQDLLSLSRQGVFDREVFNLNRVIEEYLASPGYEQLCSDHPQVSLSQQLQPELLNISGSDIQLLKTIMNLLCNAFEANLAEGTVSISTRNEYVDTQLDSFECIPEGEYVILEVADTGIGINSADLTHIFEPFFTKKKLGRSGTGLGMTLIWSTVKEHGGFIDLHSREGEGSCFQLYFPACRSLMTAPSNPKPLEDCLGTETVLVVDDVEQQREIATLMLTKLGYTVHSVPSGEEALAYLTHSKADILILDMIMAPGMDGLDTYRSILTSHPRQKAIIVSGFSESERVRQAQALGAGPYLRKPFTFLDLSRTLRSELDQVK